MKMYELLNKQVEEIKARLDQLKPAHEEYLQLLNVLRVVEQAASGRIPPASGPSLERRPAHSARSASSKGDRLGHRSEQILGIIRSSPGISGAQVSEKAGGLQRSNLYTLLNRLVEKGLIERRAGTDATGQPLRSMVYFTVG